jgi:hypothetical protein
MKFKDFKKSVEEENKTKSHKSTDSSIKKIRPTTFAAFNKGNKIDLDAIRDMEDEDENIRGRKR